MDTVIQAEAVRKIYIKGKKSLEVLKGIDLEVGRGESVAILGPSGAGKTTLLNVIAGLDEPSEGRVRLNGEEINRLSPSKRAYFINRNLGFVFQFFHLIAELTALENVAAAGVLRGYLKRSDAMRRAETLLGQFGLGSRLKHFPDELSGGEQQRVAIARALMNDPGILFCDEPTGNLDSKTGDEIRGFLRDFARRENKTVLIVTHDDRISSFAGRVLWMKDGQWA